MNEPQSRDILYSNLTHRSLCAVSVSEIFENAVFAIRVSATRHRRGPLNTGGRQGPVDTVEEPLENLWTREENQDEVLKKLKQAVRDLQPRFPSDLGIKVSISECELEERLLFRGRRWVPYSEPLRTRIIQETHDSMLVGHPGRNTLYAILARRFFWPQMSSDVRRFCQNCDQCGAHRIWRERKQGLLKPLPIPEQKWREISMDFVGSLPFSQSCKYMWVIVDRLGKGVIIEPIESMDPQTLHQDLLRLPWVTSCHCIRQGPLEDSGSDSVNS